eukprot:gene8467-17451_t
MIGTNHAPYGSLVILDDADVDNNQRYEEDFDVKNDTVQKFRKYTDFGIFVNSMGAIMGVAVFAVPWGFETSGIVGGVMILVIVPFLSFVTARILLNSQRILYHLHNQVYGYPEVAAISLGHPIFYAIVQISTAISCLGGCIGSMIFLAIGVIAFYLSVFIIICIGIHNIQHEDTNIKSAPLLLPRTMSGFLGLTSFLFTVHYNIMAMGAEALKDLPLTYSPIERIYLKPDYTCPISCSYITSTAIIIVFGFIGFIAFKDVPLV